MKTYHVGVVYNHTRQWFDVQATSMLKALMLAENELDTRMGNACSCDFNKKYARVVSIEERD